MAVNFSLRFTLTVDAVGVKHGFSPAGVVDNGGIGALSVVGLKFVDPKEKELAVAGMGPAAGEGVTEALEETEEKENAAAPVRLEPRACLETSDAKGYGGGSPDIEPDVFTAEDVKEKVAAPPPAESRLEAEDAEARDGAEAGVTTGAVSNFEGAGGVVGVVAELPADFGALSPSIDSGSGVTMSDLTPGF